MKKNIIIQLTLAAAILIAPALSLHAEDAQPSAKERTAQYDLDDGLAIEGYDPVAYFSGKPAKGSKSITTTYEGVTYRFATAENKAAFTKNPAKYEPAYGGWCAWAMAEDGEKVEVDPESYKIVDGRLFLYYNGLWANTRKQWDEKSKTEGESTLVKKADTSWQGFLSGKG